MVRTVAKTIRILEQFLYDDGQTFIEMHSLCEDNDRREHDFNQLCDCDGNG